MSLQLLCATIKHRLVRKQDYTRGFYVPGEALNVTCCNITNENNYRDILLILQPQCNQYGTAVHSNLLYFTLYTYCTMVNDSAQVNVNIQGLNCLKTFPFHSCFAASQPMKMRSKVSHRNTETGTCQQSAQNCQSASNDKTHEPYHRLTVTHNKREGCTDKMEGKGQSVPHESDSAEKGIYTPNPSMWISITLVTWSEASTIWHVWK